MPYEIQRYKKGFRVVSIHGTPLSKAPLTYEQALRQFRAVLLSEARRNYDETPTKKRGKGKGACGCGCGGACGKIEGGCGVCGSGSDVGGAKEYPLSDDDIQKLLGGTSLFTYPELYKAQTIDDVFDQYGRCIMLYLTEDKHTGHWVCMIKKGNTVEYFDPYGGYGPDDESKWLSSDKLRQLGQDKPILSALLAQSGYKVITNPYHFQKGDRAGSSNNTCGRHCVTRLLLAHLPLKQYAKMISDSGVSPDEFVTTFTYEMLQK